METLPLATRNRQRYYKRYNRRQHRFAKRLRFLLLGLKIINGFAPPMEKLIFALIQECISQLWPEPSAGLVRPGPVSQKRAIAAGVTARPGKGPSI